MEGTVKRKDDNRTLHFSSIPLILTLEYENRIWFRIFGEKR